MGMEMWRRISIHRTSGIVFETCDDEFACGLGRIVLVNACLGVGFQLCKSRTHARKVCSAHAVVAADQGRQRDRFWSGERRIPSGAVLHRLDRPTPRIVVCMRPDMTNQLLPSTRVLAFAE